MLFFKPVFLFTIFVFPGIGPTRTYCCDHTLRVFGVQSSPSVDGVLKSVFFYIPASARGCARTSGRPTVRPRSYLRLPSRSRSFAPTLVNSQRLWATPLRRGSYCLSWQRSGINLKTRFYGRCSCSFAGRFGVMCDLTPPPPPPLYTTGRPVPPSPPPFLPWRVGAPASALNEVLNLPVLRR